MNAAPTITVTVNGQITQIAPLSLEELLAMQGLAPDAVATAVNDDFVPRDQRAHCQLHDGDAVFTFVAITGG